MDAPPIEPPLDPPRTDPPEPAPSPAAPPPPPRRLARRSDERLLGGVAGGIADHFGIDVVFVRLAFVVTAFLGGIGVIAYTLGWLVLPEAPLPPGAEARPGDRRQLVGYGLVGLGVMAIGGPVGWTFGGAFWPVALVALGGTVLWLRNRDARLEPAPTYVSEPRTNDATIANTVVNPAANPVVTSEMATTPMPTAAMPTASAPTPARAPRRSRSQLGAITWSLLLMLAGGAWLLHATDVVDVDLGVVLALALALVGGALVVSAWWGRSRGLIVLGILLALVVGGVRLVDVPLEGGVGSATYRPVTVGAVRGSYEQAIGNLTVDLRAVDFSGVRRRVHAQLGIGQLNVTVPSGVRVVVDGHAGTGSVSAFGRSNHDCCPSTLDVVRRGDVGGGTLLLDAEVGAGNVRITRAGGTSAGQETNRGTS